MSGNKNLVLIMGKPSSGKSASLMNMTNQHEWVYFNTDLKELPFRDNFLKNAEISNPLDILRYIKQVEQNPDVKGAVLDTITFLMSMYERMYVVPKAGTKEGQKAWGDYGNFYREFIHAIKAGSKDYAIMAHEQTLLNEEKMEKETKVPVKGAVGNIGVEADFTTILSCKQVPIEKLEGYENDLLHITPEEEEDGFKYVFVTRITKEYAGEKMRSARDLWERKELYIDNNIQQVFDRLHEYYGTGSKDDEEAA